MPDEHAVAELLRELIRVPSPTGDEAAICRALSARLTATGWRDVRLVGSGNVIASRGDGPLATLLVAYLDSAPAGTMRAPFSPAADGASIRGRGACVKAGLAAFIAAAEASGAPVVLAATTRDNDGLREVLDSSLPPVSGALAAEPTDGALGIAARGLCWLDITIRGRPGHAGRPAEGSNPIAQLPAVLAALATLPLRADPALGWSTLAPVAVSSERSVPLTPETVTLRVDRRLLPDETPESARRELELTLVETGATVVLVTSMHPFRADPDSAVVEQLGSAARAVLGEDAARVALPYATNAGLLAANGIATVAFGPARIGDLGNDEHVALESLVSAARVVTEFLRSRAKSAVEVG